MPIPEASDSLASRLKSLFKDPPRNAWDRVVRAACLFVVFYVAAIIAEATPWRWVFILPVKRLMDACFNVSLVIFSIWYGGILTDFYAKLTGFGITNTRVNRRGQDPGLTSLWMERIRGSKEVTIVGTLSKGWFVQAPADLDEFVRSNPDLAAINIFLLDPFGNIWRAMVETGGNAHVDFIEDVLEVLRSVHSLAAKHATKLRVHFYDTDPISCVIARGAIYLGLYLPRTSRREIPEFTISIGSFLGDNIGDSVRKLRSSAPTISAQTIEGYRSIMKQHHASTREQFWNDPRVYCDFCKEAADMPSTFSRRHAEFAGSRLTQHGDRFFIVPTLGPLTADHALVVPKAHVTSSARLEATALAELAGIIATWFSKAGGNGKVPLIFEHGIPSEDTSYGGCGVCHCHVHMLSVEEAKCTQLFPNLEQILSERSYNYQLEELGSWEEIIRYREAAYLAVQYDDTHPKVIRFVGEAAVESQLMRRFVASRLLGNPVEWDWRTPQRPDELASEKEQITASVERIRSMFG